MIGVAPPARPITSPYKGLAPYTEDDSEWFFGRDEQVRVVATNVISARITILYGESGVGKTSLLRAGVLPALRQEAARDAGVTGRVDFRVALHNRWHGDAIPALEQSLRAAIPDIPDLGASTRARPLAAVLDDITGSIDADLFVILDQFEEWFLYHSRDGDAGPELVRALGNVDLPVHFLISLREDALAQLDRFKGRIPGLFENLLRLHHLDRGGAREAIEGPVIRHNRAHPEDPVEIEPGLAGDVLDQVRTGAVVVGDHGHGTPGGNGHAGARERVEAPFLQLVMTRLWEEERTAGSRCLRSETLARLGGADRIVGTHLDQTMDALDPGQCAVAADAFNHLVTPSGTKVAHTVSDLIQYTGAPADELKGLLNDLSRMRILRPVARAGDDHPAGFEIFHDVLARSVLDWRSRYLYQRSQRELADNLKRRHRRLSTLVAALVVGVVALGAAAWWFHHRWTSTNTAKLHQAESVRLSALSTTLLPSDPQSALDKALSAVQVFPSRSAQDALRNAAPPSLRLLTVLKSGEAQQTAAFTADGSILSSGVGEATLWRRDGARLKTFGKLHDPGPTVPADDCCAVLSGRGHLLVTVGLRGRAHLWTLPRLTTVPVGRGVTGAAVSQDERRIVTWGTHSVAVWDTTGRHLALIPAGSVVDAAFTEDGRRVLTVDANGDVRAWSGRRYATRDDVLPLPGAKQVVAGPHALAVVVPAAGPAVLAHLGDHTYRKLLGNAAAIDSASFDRTGRHVVTASEDGLVRVYDTKTAAPVVAVPTNGGAVKDATFSHDGALVATATNDGRARLRNALGGFAYLQLAGATGALRSVAFSRDDRFVVAASDDGTARVWTVEPRTKTAIPARFTPRSPNPLAVGPQTVFDVATAHGHIAFVSPQAGTFWWNPGTPPQRISATPSNGVGFSPDGRYFVTTTRPITGDMFAFLWRTSNTSAPIRRLDLSDLDVTFVVHHPSFAPDGRSVVLATNRGAVIWRWAAPAAASTRRFQTNVQPVAAAFSPDGKMIVTGGVDGTVRLWNAATLRAAAHPWRLGGARVVAAAFDPTSTHVVAGTEGGRVAVWDVGSGNNVSLPTLPAIVTDVRFTANGRWVIIASTDGTVRVWDWRRGVVLTTLQLHAGATRTAELMPGTTTQILSTGDDGITEIAPCDTCGPLRQLIRTTRAHERQLR